MHHFRFQNPFNVLTVSILGRNDNNIFALDSGNNNIILQSAADLAVDTRTSYMVSAPLMSF